MSEKIIIGSDHGGFELKEKIKSLLAEESFIVEDAGCFDGASVHYPEIAKIVAGKVSNGEIKRGILICGTGIGMSLAANRFKNVRATLCHDHITSLFSREHNDSNLLVMGQRVLGDEVAFDIVKTWLYTEFEGGRHQTRISMLDN